jgi:hypothetical protein
MIPASAFDIGKETIANAGWAIATGDRTISFRKALVVNGVDVDFELILPRLDLLLDERAAAPALAAQEHLPAIQIPRKPMPAYDLPAS